MARLVRWAGIATRRPSGRGAGDARSSNLKGNHLPSSPSLRHRSRIALIMAVIAAAAAASFGAGLWSTSGSQASSAVVDVFPIPGGHIAAPSTQLTFRGVPASSLGSIVVKGSKSGVHAGRVLSDSDGEGGSFMPTKPFTAGETVTVQTSLNIAGATNGAYSFVIATPAGRIPVAAPQEAPRVAHDINRFASAPQLQPATLHLTKRPSHAAGGDLFVAPQDGPVQWGPEITGPYGSLIWFKTVPKGESATDFRVQSYQGKPVLTWWQGTVNGGVGTGQDEIYNSSYQPVATVTGTNGIRSDLHEFQLTSQNTALVTGYFPVYVNASGIKHGSKHELVYDSVAQEVDIPTGLVLWQWDSLDHVALSASEQPAPTVAGHPWDYFHINSIQQAPDGTIVVSSRNTWSIYDISHQSDAVNWILNGKSSTFKMGPNTTFAFQHDARLQANGDITIFDDGAGPPNIHTQSRGITLKLDTTAHTATLVTQDEHAPGLLAQFEGSVQPQSNGDDLVGWGGQPYLTEFNPRGQEVFDARFTGANSSYRAYRFPWTGTPKTNPSVATRVSGTTTTVYASWNGATQVARWQVLGGGSATSLKTVASAAKGAFETAIKLPHSEAYVATQALDSRGHVLGTSKPAKVS